MSWNPQYHALRSWVKGYDEGRKKSSEAAAAAQEARERYPETMPQPANSELLRLILDLDERLSRYENSFGAEAGQTA